MSVRHVSSVETPGGLLLYCLTHLVDGRETLPQLSFIVCCLALWYPGPVKCNKIALFLYTKIPDLHAVMGINLIMITEKWYYVVNSATGGDVSRVHGYFQTLILAYYILHTKVGVDIWQDHWSAWRSHLCCNGSHTEQGSSAEHKVQRCAWRNSWFPWIMLFCQQQKQHRKNCGTTWLHFLLSVDQRVLEHT